MLLALDRRRPLVEQIVRHFSRAIRSGELSPGARLPASRRLAASQKIARNTVVSAYQQLAAEGYVETRRAGGTIVARDLPRTGGAWPTRGAERRESDAAGRGASPARRRPGAISAEGKRLLREGGVFAPMSLRVRPGLVWDFQFNVSVADAASQRAWSRITSRLVRTHEHRPPRWDPAHGVTELQEALVPFLARTRGVRARPDQILLLAAPQSAFRLVSQLLVDPGDDVVLEDPHFLGIRRALSVRGAHLVPIPSDEKGLCTSRLVSGGRPRLVYVTPSHGWPTGASLPLSRRLDLLAWARRHNAWIIESDHNSETFYEGAPIESIQGLDEDGRVLYTGTFSRLVEPHPSIAYAVVPDSLRELFQTGARLDGVTISALERDVLAEFIRGGELEKLLRRASRRLKTLRRTLLGALRSLPEPIVPRPASGGLHLYAELPGWSAAQVDGLVERAARAGVGLYPAAPYFLRAPKSPGLLFGFARLTEEEIREGIARLGEVMKEGRRDRAATLNSPRQ